ncbi:hypothetical protein BGZ79_008521, partial [Entomortierella chlamydospora]
YEGKTVELTRLGNGASESDTEKRILYNLAISHLLKAQVQMSRPKFDKANCPDFKDAFVALSGIWNLFSTDANTIFGPAKQKEVQDICYVQEMDKRNEEHGDLLDNLLELSKTRTLNDVLGKHTNVNLQTIIKPMYGSKAASEADALHVWAEIFRQGLPLDCTLSFHLGEQGSAATSLSKSLLAQVFETGATARKCDCILSIDGLEVGNFECKRAGASKQEVAFQLRKNLKINKSILRELEKYGLECPLLLNIHGNSAIIFKITKWKNIWVAAKACKTITLPTTQNEYRYFMREQIHVLANLLSHYREFASHASNMYGIHQYEAQGLGEEEVVSLKPENFMAVLEWEQVVLHTPSKPKQASRLLPVLSRDFLQSQRVQEDFAEEDIED